MTMAQAATAEPERALAQMPDFFVVGHPKSGTTALYEMLKAHPQIYMCPEKEPWFFASELRFRPPPRKPVGIPRTLEEYLSLFQNARPDQRVGEASTPYLWSHSAAAAIAEAQPAAKIVAVLREPVSFLRSLHLQFLEAYIETETDLGRALALEQARSEGRHIPRDTYWPQMLLYSEHVRYVEQLRRYRAVFAPEQLLVLAYEDFRRDNQATVRQVLRFLEVENTQTIEPVQANPSVRPRSQRANALIQALTVGRGPLAGAVKRPLKVLIPQGPRRRALDAFRRRMIYAEPLAPDNDLARQLRMRFKQEVLTLSDYLERDFAGLWGYDRD
jgi:hypothetical protein